MPSISHGRFKRTNSIALDQSPRKYTQDWSGPSPRRVNSEAGTPNSNPIIPQIAQPARRKGYLGQSDEIIRETMIELRGAGGLDGMSPEQIDEEYRLFMTGALRGRDNRGDANAVRNAHAIGTNSVQYYDARNVQQATRSNPPSHIQLDENMFSFLESDEDLEGGNNNATGTIPTEASIMGPAVPFLVNVSLRDLGSSQLLTQPWYLIWKFLFFMACMAMSIVTMWNAVGAPNTCAAFVVVFITISSLFSTRRAVQYQLICTRDPANTDALNELQPYSSAEVLHRQACLIVWFSVGLGLTGLYNGYYAIHGIVVTFYGKSSFYQMLATGILCILDMFIGMVPTRSTYVIVAFAICSISPFLTGWGFPPLMLVVCAAIMGVLSSLLGLILHIICRVVFLRMETVRNGTQGTQSRSAANQESDRNV